MFKKRLKLILMPALFVVSTLGSAYASCPDPSVISEREYKVFEHSDGTWRFDSINTKKISVVFVKAKNEESAKIALKNALINLPRGSIKNIYCIYRGSLSSAEFWPTTYPTVLYDPR